MIINNPLLCGFPFCQSASNMQSVRSIPDPESPGFVFVSAGWRGRDL